MAEGTEEIVANGTGHPDARKLHHSVSFKEKSIFHEQMISFFCSVYGQFVIIIFIAADLALALYGETNSYFQWLYTYIYLISILFFVYVCIFVTDKKKEKEVEADESSSSETSYIFQFLPQDIAEQLSSCCKQFCTKLYRVHSAKSHSSMFFLGGIFMFGIAGMIYSGIILAKDISMINHGCPEGVLTVHMINEVLAITFIFMQTYFIFTNYHMNFVSSKSFVRFGITHVVSTNICMTLGALMQETMHAIHKVNGHDHDDHHGDDHDYQNITTVAYSNHSEGCDLQYLEKIEHKIAHYLLPTVIEHGILSTYVLWSIKSKIGRFPKESAHHHHSNRKKFSLIGSRKGFACGMLIFIMAFVNIVLFLMIGKDYDAYQMEIPHIVILIICIISTFIGFYRINHLRIIESDHGSQKEVSNNILLRLSLCGAYLFYVLMIVAGFLSDSGNDMILTSTVGVLNVVQLTQQIFFMYDITYRVLDPPVEGKVSSDFR